MKWETELSTESEEREEGSENFLHLVWGQSSWRVAFNQDEGV